MGYDSVLNGANEINCSYRIFSKPELTRAWEEGKAQAEKDKKN